MTMSPKIEDSVYSMFITLLLALGVTARADDNPSPADPALEEADRRSAAIRLRIENGTSGAIVDRVAQPALRFEDPTRANDQGTLWVWGLSGRPVAVLELYRNTSRDWIYVLNRLTGGPLTARRGDALWWEPREATVRFSALTDAAAPAGSPTQRLVQMRALARRFSAHEFWDPDNSRYELRLLPQPLHRYHDSGKNVRDGALFAFANGTNPEVLLLLEACEGPGESGWQFGAARMGHAEIHLLLDGHETWRAPRVDPSSSREPYWLYFEPAQNAR
jgi:hypothetical protein